MIDHRKTLNVLHLASFNGNIGDLANHAGTRKLFCDNLSYNFHYTQLEIREFYWLDRRFDESFINYANQFDLLLIGGGNYFELWVDHSATGTSIDIAPELLKLLTVPTIFYALGVDVGQGYSEQSQLRFSAFIASVIERSNVFVCVRNDGSNRALREVVGEEIAALIPVMPDGGFFAHTKNYRPTRHDSGCIGINIAGDMLERRFSMSYSPEAFLEEFAMACIDLMDSCPSVCFELIPHIWRDCAFIADLLPLIPDSYLRRRISVARLEPNENGLVSFLECYHNLDLVLGMRFHANVCPIGMGVPTRGLSSYPQIQHLYEELDLRDRLIDVRQPGFGKLMAEATRMDILQLPEQRRSFSELALKLENQAQHVLKRLDEWLLLNIQ